MSELYHGISLHMVTTAKPGDPPTAPRDRGSYVPQAALSAGAQVILEAVGGADLGGHFSALDLAEKVFLAMDSERD